MYEKLCAIVYPASFVLASIGIIYQNKYMGLIALAIFICSVILTKFMRSNTAESEKTNVAIYEAQNFDVKTGYGANIMELTSYMSEENSKELLYLWEKVSYLLRCQKEKGFVIVWDDYRKITSRLLEVLEALPPNHSRDEIIAFIDSKICCT